MTNFGGSTRVAFVLTALAALAVVGCSGAAGNDGADGRDGADGSDGNDGATPPQPIVRLDEEPAGDNCAHGGTAVHVGLDGNRNGVLDDTEITGTSYICTPGGPAGIGSTLQGSFTVRNSLDAGFLHGVTRITGDLTVDAPGLIDLALPTVAQIDGNVRVQNNGTLVTLSIPSLVAIGGLVNINGNGSLATVELPQLAAVGGAMSWTNNAGLAELTLPALHTVGGTSSFTNNAVLTELALPALTAAQIVNVYDAQLAMLSVGALVTATEMRVRGANQASVSLPAATTIGLLRVEQGPTLTAVSAPVLASGRLELSLLPNLSSVTIPSLVSPTGVRLDRVGLTDLDAFSNVTAIGSSGLVIETNSKLDDVTGLASVTSVGGQLVIQNNSVLETLELSALQTVSGDLFAANNAALATLQLPVLQSVTGSFSVTNHAALTAVGVPALASVTGNLTLSNNAGLAAFQAAALQSVTGSLTVTTSAALPSLSLPSLTSVTSSLSVGDNPSLTAVDLPVLASAGHVAVWGNSALASLGVEVLASVQSLSISGTALTSLSLPTSTSAGTIVIASNPSLVNVSLAALHTAGQVYLQGPQLKTVELDSIAHVECGIAVDYYSSSFSCTPTTGVLSVTIVRPNATAVLERLSLPSLSSVAGAFHVFTPVAELELGVLTHVGALNLWKLAAVPDLSTLTTASSVAIYDSEISGTLDVSNLTLAGGNFELGNVSGLTTIAGPAGTADYVGLNNLSLLTSWTHSLTAARSITVSGTGLTSISAPFASLASLYIQYNAQLTAIAFPSLTSVTHFFYIQSNTSLPTCQATNLRGQLTTSPTTSILFNGSGSCP